MLTAFLSSGDIFAEMRKYMNYHDALFFDIDGTIISERTHTIPESAVKAIEAAGKNGCLTFINTGRTYFFVPIVLKKIAFDGFLCGCGTHIISRLPESDKISEKISPVKSVDESPFTAMPEHLHTLYHRLIPQEESLQIIQMLQECNIDGVLEGECFNYFSHKKSRFEQINEIRDSFLGNVTGRARFFDDPDIRADKFVIWTDENSDIKTFLDFAEKKNYDVIDRRFGFYEIVPNGHSKATAIEFILKQFGLGKEHAYVFGDSSNDLPMFTCVPNTIAMGEYDPVLKPYASFVTKTVEDDGIAYALKHFGFI